MMLLFFKTRKKKPSAYLYFNFELGPFIAFLIILQKLWSSFMINTKKHGQVALFDDYNQLQREHTEREKSTNEKAI